MNSKDLKKLNSVISEIPHVKDRLSSEASPSMKEELLVKLQGLYATVIFLDPIFALECKYEVEVWNEVFRNSISTLQNALRQKVNSAPGGQPPSEIQQRLVLVLDRANGFYLSLAQKLLHRIQEGEWPRNVLRHFHELNNTAEGKQSRRRWGPDRFDLDNVTLKIQFNRSTAGANHATTVESHSRLAAANKECIKRPKILSRGAQLPEPASSLFEPPNPVPQKVSQTTTLTFAEAVAYLVQHCLIHLGDIARYQHQHTSASSYYTWAWIADPSSGHAYNQLAIIESAKTKKQLDSLCYFYVRAMACKHPFPAAWVNLGHIMTMMIDATQGAFSRLFESLAVLDNFCENFLQTPMPLLLRFHAFARANQDQLAIVSAAKEYATTVDAFVAVVKGDLAFPGPLGERVRRMSSALEQLNFPEVPWHSLRVLQSRLLKVVSVHAYGLETTWSCSGDKVLRHCLLYTTVGLVNWVSSLCMAVLSKFPSVDQELPIMPLLILVLALNRLCDLPPSSNQKVTDGELLFHAPAFDQSTIELLNELSLNGISGDFNSDNLSKLNLPELYALQGFSTLGLPVVREPPLSRTFDDLMPSTFFKNDVIFQGGSFIKRARLLVLAFRSLAKFAPCLLTWSDSTQTFAPVNRRAPSLPEVAPKQPTAQALTPTNAPSPVVEEAKQQGDSNHGITEDDKTPSSIDTQKISSSSAGESAGDISSPPTQESCEAQGHADEEASAGDSLEKNKKDGALDHAESQSGEEKENPSNKVSMSAVSKSAKTGPKASASPAQPVTNLSPASKNGQKNSVNMELARFIQEQATQVAARQNKMFSEASVNAAAANDNCGASRAQKDMPPRFTKHHQNMNASGNSAFLEPEGNRPPPVFSGLAAPPLLYDPRSMRCAGFAPPPHSMFAPMPPPMPFQACPPPPPKWGPVEGGWLTGGTSPRELYRPMMMWQGNANNNNAAHNNQYSNGNAHDEGTESSSKPALT